MLAVATSVGWRLQACTKEKLVALFGVYRGLLLDNSDHQVSGGVKSWGRMPLGFAFAGRTKASVATRVETTRNLKIDMGRITRK